MAATRRIGILTGGGDVPGLNAVIKSVVYRATAHTGYEVVGLRRGWKALTDINLSDGEDRDYMLPLNRQNTRIIDRSGGTFLHTSRTNPSKMQVEKLAPHVAGRAGSLKQVSEGVLDATPIVLENLQKLKIDALVAIGGDDTLSYASRLADEGFQVVAVPKTMDNDVRNTEYCIGFSTAMTRAVDAINRMRTTLGSHERVGIFRIFGRDAGFTALYAAYVTSIRCCIPEAPFDAEQLAHLVMEDKNNNPSGYAMLLMSEGASWAGHAIEEYGPPDAFGHRKKISVASQFSAEFTRITGEETTVADLTYDLRSGEPDFLDKMVANSFATMAFDCVASGAKRRMMAIKRGCYADVDIPDPTLGPRTVDVATMYDTDRFRPNYASKNGLPIFMLSA